MYAILYVKYATLNHLWRASICASRNAFRTKKKYHQVLAISRLFKTSSPIFRSIRYVLISTLPMNTCLGNCLVGNATHAFEVIAPPVFLTKLWLRTFPLNSPQSSLPLFASFSPFLLFYSYIVVLSLILIVSLLVRTELYYM